MGQMLQRLLLAITLTVTSLLPGMLYPGAAGAASDVLDQCQTVSNNYVLVNHLFGTLEPMDQTVTTGLYGNLDRVSVLLEDAPSYPTTSSIIVTIQTVANGLRSGTVIGRGAIAGLRMAFTCAGVAFVPTSVPILAGWFPLPGAPAF